MEDHRRPDRGRADRRRAQRRKLDEHTLGKLFPRRDVLPFDATRQFMATAHDGDGQGVVYIKGALERLLPLCVDQLSANGPAAAHRPGGHRKSRSAPTPSKACASFCWLGAISILGEISG